MFWIAFITEQKCKRNNLKDFTELQFIEEEEKNLSIEINSLGPYLWISHDWAGILLSSTVALCDKTPVGFYCPQHKVHLCND
jgi:hypothetical protein